MTRRCHYKPGHIFTGKVELMIRLDILKRRKREIFDKKVERFGFCPCYVCKRPVDWKFASLEHIKPLSKGGNDSEENLSISHKKCNYEKGDK